ncbi:UNVERIFIED_CONTAM: hypothetical protein Slati_3653800 [Sesamum latifolium]|uniref:RNase H type-1 domain-containing protein n=1 Tax=Sesamum latifolium TaxID=2727402 RepID=A0AAW2U4L6_9LAMI
MRNDSFSCPLCHAEQEDAEHAFLRCPFARQVWSLSHLRWALIPDFSTDSRAWIEKTALGVKGEEFDYFLILCWAMWWNRNRTLMEHTTLWPEELVQFTKHYLHSFHQVHASPNRFSGVKAVERWSPPASDWINVNFDGAIFTSTAEIGIGVIARDSRGHCVGWKSVRQRRVADAELVEAFAAREAISFAHPFQWPRIILEGDCSNIIVKLSAPGLDSSSVGPILRDVKFIAADFNRCYFSHIRRTGNRVAHYLGRHASCSVSGDIVLPQPCLTLLSSDIE